MLLYYIYSCINCLEGMVVENLDTRCMYANSMIWTPYVCQWIELIEGEYEKCAWL